ncbi:MAG: tyrosine-protein phosphatase [Myxococcales bacterium]|jgi:protein-tyrosine phosphatase
MFIDLHCHLLPGIDDGAADAREAMAMARALVELGFGAAAPSPHAGRGYPGAEVAERRLEELRRLLEQSGVALALYPNAENFLDADFVEQELAGKGRHIGATHYVLVEAPYQAPVPTLPELVFQLRRKGVRPVFAHPERCAEFQEPGRAEAAARGGALLQLNLGSLWGRYGRSVRKTARRLLEAGLYAVAATDLHDSDDAVRWCSLAIRELESEVGAAAARRLLEENPGRVLRGEELGE